MRTALFFVLLVLMAPVCLGQNIHKDIELGSLYSQYIEESIGIYENDSIRDFVEQVGNRVTSQMDEPLFNFSYTILADPEPNAFSIPGGHLYITTGMFPFLETEDELACIMAHEIIHAQNRHVIKSNRRGIIPGILQIPGAVIGVFNPDLGNAMASPFRELGKLTHASYNRKQETEADLEGLKLAAKAGYNPDALISILSRIEKYSEMLQGAPQEKDPLASHPMTEDRVRKIVKIKPKLEQGTEPPLAADFFGIFNGALAGRNPGNGIIKDSLYANVGENFKIVFPSDWDVDFNSTTIVGGNADEEEFLQADFKKSDEEPDSIAAKFLSALNTYGRSSVIGNEPVLVNESQGHMIAFKESTEEKTFHGFRLWVRKDSLLFDFIAISTQEDQNKMEEVVLSLSDIDPGDYEIIEYPVLELVESEENETASSIAKRTHSNIEPEMILLINGKEEGEVFQKGEAVKVMIPRRFESLVKKN
jgi:predicted Zn-dependent protease